MSTSDSSSSTKQATASSGKRNRCDECGITFKWRCNYLTHRREKHRKSKETGNTGEKRFECDVCGKGFMRRANMKQHMLTHKKVTERPIKCPHCDETFNQKSNMKRHALRRHEMPFSCRRCKNTRFATQEELVAHANATHANDDTPLNTRRPKTRKILCSCKKSFVTREELIDHQNSDCLKLKSSGGAAASSKTSTPTSTPAVTSSSSSSSCSALAPLPDNVSDSMSSDSVSSDSEDIFDTWHEDTHDPARCVDSDACELWPDVDFDRQWPWDMSATDDSDDSSPTTPSNFGRAPPGGPSASPERSAANGPTGVLLDTGNSLDRELAARVDALSLGR